MSIPYLPRLVCLAVACFFLVYLAATLAVAIAAPPAIRIAERLSPRRAARLLLSLRLLPAGLALLTVAVCVPSYLRFETERFDEPVGLTCLIAAFLGMVLQTSAIARAARAVLRSAIFLRRCRKLANESGMAGGRCRALVLETRDPCLALTGILRPCVVVSRGILEALSEEELATVLSHENAHRSACDNLKRLCLFLAPGSKLLERAWMNCAEYAADREAVRGDARRSIALASALVRVARFGGGSELSPVATSFLARESDLSARVDRLLAAPPSAEIIPKTPWRSMAAAAVLIGIVFQPATLRLVHTVLERLVS